MRLKMTFAVIVLSAAFGYSKTIHVPADYSKIQDAIVAAMDGDMVLVAPGTYVENIDFKGKAVNVKSLGGPGETVIDGKDQLLSVVRFENGEGLDSVLDGFTLTNGSGTFAPTVSQRVGGGIFCEQSSPFIKNNVIQENSAQAGGGIYCLNGSSPVIAGNIVRGNSAALAGGGIFCRQDSSPELTDNVVSANTAKNSNGGGVFLRSNCLPRCTNCVFSDNGAGHVGGGFSIREYCDVTLVNCMFIGNAAEDWGGGIRIGALSNATLTNCTFFGNHAADAGGAFAAGSDAAGPVSQISMTNCVLWGNTSPSGPEIALNGLHPAELTISCSDVQGGEAGAYVEPGFILNWGAGMIDADPLFVDSAGRDFHLRHPSPCKDGGDASAPGLADFDFEGDPRIAHGNLDMGADEFHGHLYYVGDATPGGQVGLCFIGDPGDPILLFVGSGVLDPPWLTKYGVWHLQFPLLFQADFGFLPPDGAASFPCWISSCTPTPLDFIMQAGLGMKLSNLCVMEVMQ